MQAAPWRYYGVLPCQRQKLIYLGGIRFKGIQLRLLLGDSRFKFVLLLFILSGQHLKPLFRNLLAGVCLIQFLYEAVQLLGTFAVFG